MESVPNLNRMIWHRVFSSQAHLKRGRPSGIWLRHRYSILAYYLLPLEVQLSKWVQVDRERFKSAEGICKGHSDVGDVSIHMRAVHEQKILSEYVRHTRSHGGELGCRSISSAVSYLFLDDIPPVNGPVGVSMRYRRRAQTERVTPR